MPRSVIGVPRTVAGTRTLVKYFYNSLSLSGAASTNVTSAAVSPAAPLSMAAWVRPSSIGSNMNIMCGNGTNGADLDMLIGGQMRLSRLGSDSTIRSSYILTANTWQHIAVTYDAASNYVFYYNGVKTNTGNSAQTFVALALMIGQEAGFGLNFNGLMNGVMLYNVALSVDEVFQIANLLTIPQAGNLLVHLKFNDGTGTSAADSSGNGKTGTLNGAGATWSTNTSSPSRTTAGARTVAV